MSDRVRWYAPKWHGYACSYREEEIYKFDSPMNLNGRPTYVGGVSGAYLADMIVIAVQIWRAKWFCHFLLMTPEQKLISFAATGGTISLDRLNVYVRTYVLVLIQGVKYRRHGHGWQQLVLLKLLLKAGQLFRIYYGFWRNLTSKSLISFYIVNRKGFANFSQKTDSNSTFTTE